MRVFSNNHNERLADHWQQSHVGPGPRRPHHFWGAEAAAVGSVAPLPPVSPASRQRTLHPSLRAADTCANPATSPTSSGTVILTWIQQALQVSLFWKLIVYECLDLVIRCPCWHRQCDSNSVHAHTYQNYIRSAKPAFYLPVIKNREGKIYNGKDYSRRQPPFWENCSNSFR